MDQAHAHEITWIPAQDPPVRYFYERPSLCLTVRNTRIQKATLADDPMGVSYVNPAGRRLVPWDRSVTVQEEGVELIDRQQRHLVAMDARKFQSMPSGPVPALSPIDWRSVFVEGVPQVQAGEVFGAMLLYPDDQTPAGELAAQPFVADYLQDLAEQDREIGHLVSQAEHILIDNGDAVIATCIPFDRPRDVVVYVRFPAFAMKQAQQIWSVCAEVRRWEWPKRTRFVERKAAASTGECYDLAYVWVPYEDFEDPEALDAHGRTLASCIRSGGDAFVVGPVQFRSDLGKSGFGLCREELVQSLPTFEMHRTILPRANVKAGLTLFHVRRL